MSGLLNCPFCGCNAKVKRIGSAFTIYCENLHRINSFESREEAVRQWNTRPIPVAPVSPDATGKCGELVTVGEVSTVRESIAAFAGHMLSRQLKPGDLLCLRSQAVKLLAEKDVIIRSHLATIASFEIKLAALEEARAALSEAIEQGN
ncbi:Lar family restriction alleviation protein [Brucella intermedia]|uniref:Lar family restriction alleviation protein n=1 Tax=Brucella intermedia TaxID=94625 RepID=UPI0007C70A80|nr:Lar family restriction alleviation protein [Brucella intermedia]OAE43938.1 hypothetical protein A7J42_00680 [Brucella intermedia]